MPTFGEIIRQRRKELGWTQDDLAKKLGYKSRTTISRIEDGSRDVPQKQTAKIAKALMMDPVDFITLQMGMKSEEDLLIESYLEVESIKKLVLCAGGIMPEEDRDKFIEAFLNASEVLKKRGG